MSVGLKKTFVKSFLLPLSVCLKYIVVSRKFMCVLLVSNWTLMDEW